MNETLQNANSLGERLYLLRESRNLSQDELAEQLNVSRQTISNWENDKVKLDVEKAAEICRFYDISMDELFLGKEKPQTQAPNKRNIKTVLLIIALCVAVAFMIFGIVCLVFFPNPKNPANASSMVIISDTGAWVIAIGCGIVAIAILLYLVFKDRKKP